MNRQPRTMKTKKPSHPQHKAREIRLFTGGEIVSWTIYPEQLPAMAEAMATAIRDEQRAWYGVSMSFLGSRNLASAALKSIGLVAPKGKKR